MSNFKTNEHASLLGGSDFEPAEHNTMLGFCGASRSNRCVREDMGSTCETDDSLLPPVDEAERVLSEMVRQGLAQGSNAARRSLARIVTARKIGICGQAHSDYPDYARFLVENGIDSISLNPDSVRTPLSGWWGWSRNGTQGAQNRRRMKSQYIRYKQRSLASIPKSSKDSRPVSA